MTDAEWVAAKLQDKFNKGYALSGDEDYMLELSRERAIEQRAKRGVRGAAPQTTNKRSTMVTQAEVDGIARRAFKKAMHLSDADEQHLRNLRDTVRAANAHLDKIAFDDRAPQGSDLESRTASDATMPAKAAIDANLLKGRDLARLVGTAVAKAAQSRPLNMNPARSDEDIPTLPGKPVSS
jgi:hypothetical protein